MKIRTLAAACAAAGLATLVLSPAVAVVDRTGVRPAAAAAVNPCNSDPQSGGPIEKISGPGPQFDNGYGMTVATRAGSCVKVFKPNQQGGVTHTVVVRSDGQVQRRVHGDGTSVTRLAHHNGTNCRVTVIVRISHPGRNDGVYQAKIGVAHCALYG